MLRFQSSEGRVAFASGGALTISKSGFGDVSEFQLTRRPKRSVSDASSQVSRTTSSEDEGAADTQRPLR